MSTAADANSYILKKYCWMSRQLRNFNDSNSIFQWSNAMLSIKNLLLQPKEDDTLFPTILSTNSANTSNKHPALTISRLGSTTFLPAAEPCHTLSRTWNATYLPQPPSPLSIYTSRELSIPPHTPPDDSHNPPSKRRKTVLPPEVDYNAKKRRATENNLPTTAPSTNSSNIIRTSLPTSKTMPTSNAWVLCRCPNSGHYYFWNHISEAVQDFLPDGGVQDPNAKGVKRRIYRT